MTTPAYVVFSDRAYNAMVSETFAHDPIETGGFLLGYSLDNGCRIVVEAIPPGPKSTHRTAFFEYDTPFVNYVANTVARQYQMPLRLLGLWHRHPGNMNTFSSIDDETNARLAAAHSDGILSGLVNMVPDFHLTLYYTVSFGKYAAVPFAVGDSLIPETYLTLRHTAVGLHPALPAKKGAISPETPRETPVSKPEEVVEETEQPRQNTEKTDMLSDTKTLPPTVIYPVSMEDTPKSGPIRGKYCKETNTYNVVPLESRIEEGKLDEIGRVFPECPFENPSCIQQLPKNDASDDEREISPETLSRAIQQGVQRETPLLRAAYRDAATWRSCNPCLIAYPEKDRLRFVQYPSLRECRPDRYSLQMDLFSRNKGLLESDIMVQKGAVLVGCGSVGSLFAMELARAGLGRFLLIDQDILGYHNICRHQCGVLDVGKFKTDAVRERILEINPTARIEVFHAFIQSVPLDVLDAFCNSDTIFIGGADNREGDLYASRIAAETQAAFLSVGCWERAYAGEIFYNLPERDMASYEEFLEATQTLVPQTNPNRIFYTNEQDLSRTVFEPGISTDISYVTTIAIKLALDILNRNESDYTPRVLNDLAQFTLVCNTNDPKLGGNLAWMFSRPLQVSKNLYIRRESRPAEEFV